MRRGTLIILLLICVVSVGAASAVLSRDDADPRFERVGQPVFPGLIDRVNDVSEFVVESAEGRVTVFRKGKVWRLRESDNHLASPKEVFKAVVGIAALKYFEPKTERSERYGRLQLNDPASGGGGKRMTLKAAGDTVADVIVGREKLFLPGRTVGGIYFRRPGELASWLGEGNPEAGGAPKDWLARKIVDVKSERVSRVRVRHADGEVVVVSKPAAQSDKFFLEGIPDGMRLKYDSDADNIGSILEQLEMEDARRASSVEVDFTDALVVEAETFDGLVGTLEIVKRDEIRWLRARFTGKNQQGDKEAKVLSERTSEWLYMMPAYEVIPVRRRMRDLLIPKSG